MHEMRCAMSRCQSQCWDPSPRRVVRPLLIDLRLLNQAITPTTRRAIANTATIFQSSTKNHHLSYFSSLKVILLICIFVKWRIYSSSPASSADGSSPTTPEFNDSIMSPISPSKIFGKLCQDFFIRWSVTLS